MGAKILLYVILTILAFCQKAFCQQKKGDLIYEVVAIETDPIFNPFIDIRRELDENPKLAYRILFSVNKNTSNSIHER